MLAVKEANFITVSHINKRFPSSDGGLEALSDISFSVEKGEMICIVGASGCGKSTLLRAIAGIDPVHEGTVTIAGNTIVRPEKNIGIVFQEHRLFPWLTVEQNIGFALNGVPKGEREAARIIFIWWGWMDLKNPSHRSFPEVWRSAQESRGRLSTIRRCCSWMNRLVHWIHLQKLRFKTS